MPFPGCSPSRVYGYAPLTTIRASPGRAEYKPPVGHKVGQRVYSPSYAHTLLMTAKQFVNRLAKMRLIPLPGNIRSRRFRFNHSALAKIETFTVEEV